MSLSARQQSIVEGRTLWQADGRGMVPFRIRLTRVLMTKYNVPGANSALVRAPSIVMNAAALFPKLAARLFRGCGFVLPANLPVRNSSRRRAGSIDGAAKIAS